MAEQRKLAAILAADVVGYSRLAGADEDRTLARLRALRSDLVDPTIAVHGGRVVKRTGDGALAEFRSVVNAVRCAIEVQTAMVERNAGLPPERRIEFRVGIHLGDVVEESDGDLMGDGVNIAARLEGVAKPGSICLSEDAYRQVRSRLDLAISDLGETTLKNIADPIRLYALQVGLAASAQPAPVAAVGLPERPSLAVLPFQNMSGDAEQDYFADGVVEDIITALSRIRWFFVIARNSSFTYKGKAVDIRQVGRELGVRYVLEGSVRKAGNKVRITGQLIEASSARHVWAEKFDGDLADIFDLQDRITESIVGAIEPSLLSAEIARAEHKPTANLDAYDLYLRAWALYGSMNRSTIRNAIELLMAAIALDPTYAQAKALAAICHGDLVQQRWDDPEDFIASDRLAREALADARDDPIALAFASQIAAYISKDYETALAAADRALAICPNSFVVSSRCGWVKLYVGQAGEAVDCFMRAIRLSPLDPYTFNAPVGMAAARLMEGKPEEAERWARQALQRNAKFAAAHRVLIFALVEQARVEDAREALRKMLIVSPDYTLSHFRRLAPFSDRAFNERFEESRKRPTACLSEFFKRQCGEEPPADREGTWLQRARHCWAANRLIE
jgi:adenylate cyclase